MFGSDLASPVFKLPGRIRQDGAEPATTGKIQQIFASHSEGQTEVKNTLARTTTSSDALDSGWFVARIEFPNVTHALHLQIEANVRKHISLLHRVSPTPSRLSSA
jgi:hypothetical protein